MSIQHLENPAALETQPVPERGRQPSAVGSRASADPQPADRPSPRQSQLSPFSPGSQRLLDPAGNPQPALDSDAQPSTFGSSQPPFHRRAGETPRAYNAFITWFELGHSRSHQAVADKLGEGLATVKNWASKYDWSDRLQSFNEGLARQHAVNAAERQRQLIADWAGRLNRFREQEWHAAQKLLSAAQCFLESFGEEALENMTLSQVSRALRISSQIGRSALAGLELPPSSEPVLAPIQQQMLEALKRLSASSLGAAGVNGQTGSVPAVDPRVAPDENSPCSTEPLSHSPDSPLNAEVRSVPPYGIRQLETK